MHGALVLFLVDSNISASSLPIIASIDIDDVREAVAKEMDGPGSLLGYRALHKKIREVHGLSVPRNLVYAVMTEINPKGLEERGCAGRPTVPLKGKLPPSREMRIASRATRFS